MKHSLIFSTFINDGSWKKLVTTANALAPAMASRYGEGRTGGVLTLYEPRLVYPCFVQEVVGNPDPRMIHRLHAISLEKPMRGHRLGARCSFVAERDPELSQYGGAFLIPGLELWASFSGWKEVHDILFLMFVMRRARILTPYDVFTTAKYHEGISRDLFGCLGGMEETFEDVPS